MSQWDFLAICSFHQIVHNYYYAAERQEYICLYHAAQNNLQGRAAVSLQSDERVDSIVCFLNLSSTPISKFTWATRERFSHTKWDEICVSCYVHSHKESLIKILLRLIKVFIFITIFIFIISCWLVGTLIYSPKHTSHTHTQHHTSDYVNRFHENIKFWLITLYVHDLF